MSEFINNTNGTVLEKSHSSTRGAIVIDATGLKKEYVLTEEINLDGKTEVIPLFYDLKVGETFVFENIEIALTMLKSKWDGAKWIETATAEEIEVAKPEVQLHGEITLTNKQLEEQNLLIMGVAAELYEKNLQLEEQNLQTMMALTELYETITGGI